ncbi:DNA repair protein RadA [Candidatus Fermentibacteria bacterium]|nr:MAG: DNA repair protein RadA [Candidatus Fermentibacteria bacterium]
MAASSGGRRRKTAFFCTECGGESPVWAGRCPHCGAWNTMAEEPVADSSFRGRTGAVKRPKAVPVQKVGKKDRKRISTGSAEFDRVLGGGAFPGSMILLGGEPGIGKSTLMLQSAIRMAASGLKVLYASGEESAEQVASRAFRVGEPSENLMLLPTSELEAVEENLASGKYDILVVDSIQTLRSESLSSAPGSVSQVRECAAALASSAKPAGLTVFTIGHVTKDGTLAGPRVLEHLVDAVISFEGDSFHRYRLLRASKNRFGSVNELGVFEMDNSGLSEVSDASGYFLRRDEENPVTGSAVAAVVEGTRPFLVEVQALACQTSYGFPQRKSNGFDSGRLAMLIAVLEKRCGIELGNWDVFVNVAGGFSVSDTGADLAVCMAIASARLDRVMKDSIAVCGEVGLGGELRPVHAIERRSAETGNLGFKALACSRQKQRKTKAEMEFDSLSAAIAGLLSEKGGEWLS